MLPARRQKLCLHNGCDKLAAKRQNLCDHHLRAYVENNVNAMANYARKQGRKYELRVNNRTHLYAIEATGLGFVKIGRAVSPLERLNSLQVASPVELKLIGHIECGDSIEGSVHHKISDHNVRGEWFDLNAQAVKDIVRFICGNDEAALMRHLFED